MLIKLIIVFHAADNFVDSISDFLHKLLLLPNHSLLFVDTVNNRLQLGNFSIAL